MNAFLTDETIPRIYADEAERVIKATIRKQRSDIPELTEAQRAIIARKVFIFNVSPFVYEADLGQTGKFRIEPCGNGIVFSIPTVLPGAFVQHVKHRIDWADSTDGIEGLQSRLVLESGHHVASEIMRMAQGHAKIGPYSLNFGTGNPPRPIGYSAPGCFVSDMNPPSEKDVAAAKATYHQFIEEVFG